MFCINFILLDIKLLVITSLIPFLSWTVHTLYWLYEYQSKAIQTIWKVQCPQDEKNLQDKNKIA